MIRSGQANTAEAKQVPGVCTLAAAEQQPDLRHAAFGWYVKSAPQQSHCEDGRQQEQVPAALMPLSWPVVLVFCTASFLVGYTFALVNGWCA